MGDAISPLNVENWQYTENYTNALEIGTGGLQGDTNLEMNISNE